MGQQTSRPVFDSKLTKSHVEHALIQQDGRHNDIPTVLATLLFLDASPEMLKHAYRSRKDSLHTWAPSPGSITDEATKTALLGDKRFQRAFMTYFSLLNNQYNSNSLTLAHSQLFTGPKPLVYGLFSSLGLPLTFLSDGIELRSAILVAQSLTISAVDWTNPIFDLLTSPQLARPASELLSPEELLRRVAYDGRFSGVMKSGPGYHNISQIFSNPSARTAVIEYIQQLDCRNIGLLLPQLASLSVLLLTATHKPTAPAFDFYLAHLVTAVNSLRIILGILDQGTHRIVAVRGVWLLFVLVYVTQLRPVVDGELLHGIELQGGHDWQGIYELFCGEGIANGGRFGNGPFLRVMRTLWELGQEYDGVGGGMCLKAAWKMIGYWGGWTGLGGDSREVGLNIRL
ncbi:hypothetical protein QBC40DRAFT_316332 [Triangularia verruculosa]|uniref:Uncharacterized protein n=1 Tax=Triangularia verruculosa TaxID=2587418 RepID=A0AAN6XS41_9PEZI|nr:hypothetical protein QBC40DRAFT_316332 [Triangularia verruculosa]